MRPQVRRWGAAARSAAIFGHFGAAGAPPAAWAAARQPCSRPPPALSHRPGGGGSNGLGALGAPPPYLVKEAVIGRRDKGRWRAAWPARRPRRLGGDAAGRGLPSPLPPCPRVRETPPPRVTPGRERRVGCACPQRPGWRGRGGGGEVELEVWLGRGGGDRLGSNPHPGISSKRTLRVQDFRAPQRDLQAPAQGLGTPHSVL